MASLRPSLALLKPNHALPASPGLEATLRWVEALQALDAAEQACLLLRHAAGRRGVALPRGSDLDPAELVLAADRVGWLVDEGFQALYRDAPFAVHQLYDPPGEEDVTYHAVGDRVLEDLAALAPRRDRLGRYAGGAA